jgi:hypothetical protein
MLLPHIGEGVRLDELAQDSIVRAFGACQGVFAVAHALGQARRTVGASIPFVMPRGLHPTGEWRSPAHRDHVETTSVTMVANLDDPGRCRA